MASQQARDPVVIVSREESRLEPVEEARGARMAVLLGPQMARPRFLTRRFVLEPGGRIPAHRHPDIEHQQLVVRGELVLVLDGEEHQVREGDAILIPAGCVHAYVNRSRSPVEFLCVVPATDDYATEWFEEKGAELGSL